MSRSFKPLGVEGSPDPIHHHSFVQMVQTLTIIVVGRKPKCNYSFSPYFISFCEQSLVPIIYCRIEWLLWQFLSHSRDLCCNMNLQTFCCFLSWSWNLKELKNSQKCKFQFYYHATAQSLSIGLVFSLDYFYLLPPSFLLVGPPISPGWKHNSSNAHLSTKERFQLQPKP